jgi:AraC-like DNA-binding protein
MTIAAQSGEVITDFFIPELFYDFLYVQDGEIRWQDQARHTSLLLPRQALKTLYTRPIQFQFSTPLSLFGARLSLRFAEHYWEPEIRANTLIEQNWVGEHTRDLATFAAQVTKTLQSNQIKKNPYPLLTPGMDESSWLASYSPRHKRRIYKSTFGASRKELQAIRSVHAFLEQTCRFDLETPRIIEHLNPEVFYDQPHLNHAFKKMTGFLPVEYFQANSILQDNLMAVGGNR